MSSIVFDSPSRDAIRNLHLLSCSSLESDDEEELLLELEELLDELEELDDELESLSLPSLFGGGVDSLTGSFFSVIFSFGIWPFGTLVDST